MTDREKLINLILKISDGKLIYGKEETINITENLGELIDRLLSGGVTVKEPQKPLTVEELKRMDGCPVWCETEATKTPCVVKNSMIDKVDAIFYALGREYPIFFNVDGYGQTWRCWAEKPTEEERKNAEWLE